MRLEWSAASWADRIAILEYVGRERPQAAIRLDDRIEAQIEGLVRFPEIGHPGRVAGTRELVIDRTPYIAVYRILDDAVVVLRIIHGARRWPKKLPP